MIDRHRIQVYPLPPPDQIRREVDDFTRALRDGGDSTPSGRQLYASLFGQIPPAAFAHKRWLLEPDGPLYDLPFAALPVGGTGHSYLVERVALQAIPAPCCWKKVPSRPTDLSSASAIPFSTEPTRVFAANPLPPSPKPRSTPP